MSPALLADLRDHVVNVTIAGASKSSTFATYATDKLHAALALRRAAGVGENVKLMAAVLGCIIKKAASKRHRALRYRYRRRQTQSGENERFRAFRAETVRGPGQATDGEAGEPVLNHRPCP